MAIFSPGAPGSTGIPITTAPSPSASDDEVPLFKHLRFKHPMRRELTAYHALPSVLAKSAKGRAAFSQAWNKYVSPGKVLETQENSEATARYFGVTPNLARRLLWE